MALRLSHILQVQNVSTMCKIGLLSSKCFIPDGFNLKPVVMNRFFFYFSEDNLGIENIIIF